jgi:transcriptional regulator with XRE-family HTH domain
MEKLIEAIRYYQYKNRINDVQFAEQVGIAQTTLSKVKSGERGIGTRTAKALAQIPELKPYVVDYVFGSDIPESRGSLLKRLRGVFR